MDARTFLAEFGHIAAASGGMLRLRQMIYQLAVVGVLTPRLPKDGDASALLSDIELTRQRLIREHQYKRLTQLEREAIVVPKHITLPSSWCWTRLLDVGEINPRNVSKDEDLAAFIPMSGVPELHRGQLICEYRKWGEVKNGFTHFADGDVVLAKITPCFENGKAAVIQRLGEGTRIGAGTTELHVFRPIHAGVLSAYVYLFLRSPYFVVKGEQQMTGTAGQKRLPTDYFATRAFPLPPTEQQVRIVAKVDELMLLCDRLEAQQTRSRGLQHQLRVTTLRSVATAVGSQQLESSWLRVTANLTELFQGPQDVAEMRSLILDLSVRGLLTGRNVNDELPDLLISRSTTAKRVRVASGELKAKKASSTEVINTSIPTPPHWGKANLSDLFQFIDYRGQTPPKTTSGVVLVTAKNVRPGALVAEPVEHISETSYREWMTRGFPRLGDLLITTEAPLGNVARIEVEPHFALAQRIIDLQPFADLNTKCAMYFMMSPSFQQLLKDNATGMTAKGIKAAKLKQLQLPVPPREEQARIVVCVEELLKLCDFLESRFAHAERLAARFAAAAISAITGNDAALQEEEAVKAPRTELIAPLRLGFTPDVKTAAPLATILIHNNGEMNAKDLWRRFGGEIDAFYRQLKQEVAQGWIREPAEAEMRERETV